MFPKERLDWEDVVFGVCLIGCDALYERGFIGEESGGRICISDAPISKVLANLLKGYSRIKCANWKETAADYFDWHLKFRFQGKRL